MWENTWKLERACCLRKREGLEWPGLELFVRWKGPAGASGRRLRRNLCVHRVDCSLIAESL